MVSDLFVGTKLNDIEAELLQYKGAVRDKAAHCPLPRKWPLVQARRPLAGRIAQKSPSLQ